MLTRYFCSTFVLSASAQFSSAAAAFIHSASLILFMLLKQSVIEFLRSNISFLHPENLESGYRLLLLRSLLLLIRPVGYHNSFRYESHSGCNLSERHPKSGCYNGAVLIFISSANQILYIISEHPKPAFPNS